MMTPSERRFITECECQRVLAAKIINWAKAQGIDKLVELDKWTKLSIREAEQRMLPLRLPAAPIISELMD